MRVVQSVDKRFAAGMARMGNRGRVSLIGVGNGNDDISAARVAVKVAFRADEELQTLNAQRQSGGERAVSTMLFLLAMQADTPLPFRILDEINQGMDVVNERQIMETLVALGAEASGLGGGGGGGSAPGGDDDVSSSAGAGASAGSSSSSSSSSSSAAAAAASKQRNTFERGRQLFIISPKLMPDLRHHISMRTQVVFNGPLVGTSVNDAKAMGGHFTAIDFADVARSFNTRSEKELRFTKAEEKARQQQQAANGSSSSSSSSGGGGAGGGSPATGAGGKTMAIPRKGPAAAAAAAAGAKRGRGGDDDDDSESEGGAGAGAGSRPKNRPRYVEDDDDDDGFGDEEI